MNTPQNTAGAHAPPPPRGGGRSGRGGGRPQGRPTRGAGAASKVALAKIGPTRLLETEWSKDAALKGSAFVLWLGAGNAGDQQMTFHRPIGETALTQSQWVATPTRDIGYLLMRRESEELASWKRKSELAKRIAVLRAARGRKYLAGSDPLVEVWNFDGAPAIQPTIRTCMAAAKAAGAQESEWLSYSDTAVRVAEQQFKEALRNQDIPAGWIAVNPRPIHETMGGALGDTRQKPVEYLNGITAAAAKDKVLKVALGLETTDPLPLEEEDEDEEEEEAMPPPPLPATPPRGGSAGSANSPRGGSSNSPANPIWDEQVTAEEEETSKDGKGSPRKGKNPASRK